MTILSLALNNLFQKGEGGKMKLSIEGEETEKVLFEYKFQPQTLPHQTSTYIKQSNQTHSFAASK